MHPGLLSNASLFLYVGLSDQHGIRGLLCGGLLSWPSKGPGRKRSSSLAPLHKGRSPQEANNRGPVKTDQILAREFFATLLQLSLLQ